MDESLPQGSQRRDSALRAVLEGLPDAVVATRRDGLIDFVNARAAELFGYEPEELVGRPVALLWPESVREAYTRNMEELFEAGGALRFTEAAHGLRKDGREFLGEMSWGLVETAEQPLMLAVGHDISERLAMEARLRRRSAEHAVIASLGERAITGIEPFDLVPELVESVGQTLEADLAVLFELADHEHLRAAATWRRSPETPEVAWAALTGHARLALDSHDAVGLAPGAHEPLRSGLAVAVRTSDESFGVLCGYSLADDALDRDDGAFLGAVGNVLASAISRRRMEERIQHQALHDPLTGLANRTLCQDRLAQALARSRRSGTPVGVFFLDLDRFKDVNDNYGHAAGDVVLVAVAHELEQAVRPSDTVGRFGGDEFLVVCEDISEEQALALGDRLRAAARVPVEAAGAVHQLSASVGFATSDDVGLDADRLVSSADEAVYRAKQLG
jgi:diguanylate cyclase (GGDEF)-like protein/PAS domain S-box-containing protein